jgi:hypothetical protein
MANDEVRLVGDFSTPDFFADEAILFDLVNDTVRITFAVARNETPVVGSGGGLVATGRLIMPVGAAQRLSLGLHDYLNKHGLDPSAAARGVHSSQ